ncbi:FKBP-type peptidyl-prolyl cis-trans isomerase [Actinomyces sp. S4-C9]|uniref:FKBP-type peptidyl-prolyl cis-trans isomerase n=1 Tax=Actinomyces sp. S4-C9 TaxID=1219581 RepID=UPI00068B2E0A|nr:FKBP-type peptidyl-prolyl cis-trans isomerase [Actinomyces sp. S4-C9]
MSEFLKVSDNFLRKPTIEFLTEESPAGLHVEVIREGAGAPITPGNQIDAHYLGQVWNGNIFDNSYDRGEPLSFTVGIGMVIRGWDEGLIGVREGSRVVLSIPSELGYGDAGVPQAGIGGGDTLVFVTDVVRVS